MSVKPKFYVPQPMDQAWSTVFGEVVIKAYEAPGPFGQRDLKVLEPEEFARQYSIVVPAAYMECSGPARNLSRREYVVLIHSLWPNLMLPEGITEENIKEWMSGTETKET